MEGYGNNEIDIVHRTLYKKPNNIEKLSNTLYNKSETITKEALSMSKEQDYTIKFNMEQDQSQRVRDVLSEVYQALNEKGYNSINQLVGYIISGDPTYITSHKNARSLIRKVERDELLEELLKRYLEEK